MAAGYHLAIIRNDDGQLVARPLTITGVERLCTALDAIGHRRPTVQQLMVRDNWQLSTMIPLDMSLEELAAALPSHGLLPHVHVWLPNTCLLTKK